MILVGSEPFCDFSTIQEAVQLAETELADKACQITVLSGTYQERVVIHRSNLTIVGIGEVILTYGLGAKEKDGEGKELGTFRTATLFVGGSHHVIENLTIENTAGYGEIVGQALAVYADCDETIFRNCRILGYQDTLFTGLLPPKQKDGSDFVTQAESKNGRQYRQYYEKCLITGSIDFIFGGAAAVFNRCEIRSRKEGIRTSGYITAASTPEGQDIGLVFQGCWLTAEKGVEQVYLGRPWRSYAKTFFIECEYGSHIHPEGWHDWSNEKNQKTADYREYFRDTDREANVCIFQKRVSWSKINSCASSDSFEYFPDTDFLKNKREKEKRCEE